MTLTQAEMDLIDETPTIRNVPAQMSFRPVRPGQWPPPEAREVRMRRPAWRIAAERRKRQLELMAPQIEMERLVFDAS